jgi:diadenosine tetraphosphate (Ap4A) HIT family hydrolase
MASRATSHEPPATDCVFCAQPGGRLIWQDDFARVVLAGDADHPALCRVIINDHVKEMTDLEPAARDRLMRIVYEVEQVLRALLEPEKVNLASLGNMVPHLHWHIIPRFRDDPHFPNPVWGPRGSGNPRALGAAFEPALARALRQRIG